MCLNATLTKPVRQVSICFHLLECVYGLVKLCQQSSRPQPLAGVHRLHFVQAILESAGKHGTSGYRLVLLESVPIYPILRNEQAKLVFYFFCSRWKNKQTAVLIAFFEIM